MKRSTIILFAVLFSTTLCVSEAKADNNQDIPAEQNVNNDEITQIRKAAESGDTDAMITLAEFYLYDEKGKDIGLGLKWYLTAAEAENADAMYGLGELYMYGWGVVTEDPNEATKWYSKALNLYLKDAEQGDSHSMYHLGEMYYSGVGVGGEDYVEAIKWYLQAAEHGDSFGMYKVGLMYENGLGVPKNYDQARDWYKEALQSGHYEAKLRLIIVFVKKYYKFGLWGYLVVLVAGGFVYAIRKKSTVDDINIFQVDIKSEKWTLCKNVRRYVGGLLIYPIYFLILWGSISQVAGTSLSPDKAKELVESGTIESTWEYGWGDHYIYYLLIFCFVTFCCGALVGATAKKNSALVVSLANLPIIFITSLFCWLLYTDNIDVESPIAWRIVLPLSVLASIFCSVWGSIAGQSTQSEEFEDNTIFGIRTFHWTWLWLISAFYIRGMANAMIVCWSSDSAYGPGIFQILYVLIYGYPIYLMYGILSREMLAHKNVFIRIISFVGIYLGGIAAAILYSLILFGLHKLISGIF